MDDLDYLARLVRVYGVKLAYGRDGAKLAFRRRDLPAWIRRELHNHRRAIARLMLEGRIELCPSPGLHRSSWYYAGRGRYICEVCRRIDTQMCLWRAC